MSPERFLEHNSPRSPIRIGSRGSQLALWQANHILYALRDAGYHVEIEIIRTTGDRMQQPGFVPPARPRRQRHLHQGDRRGPRRRPHRPRRPLAQRPAHQTRPAVHPRRHPETRRRPRRLGLRAVTGRSTPCPTAAASAPPAPAAAPSSSPSAPTSPSSRSAATSTPASRNSPPASATPSSSPPPASTASSAPSASTSASPPTSSAPPPAREPSPSKPAPRPSRHRQPRRTRDAYIRQAIAFLDHPHTRFCRRSRAHTLDSPRRRLHAPHRRPLRPRAKAWRMYAQVVAPDGEIHGPDRNRSHPLEPPPPPSANG